MSYTNNTDNNDGCSSFLTLLTILFVILKLNDVIDWSWWWVFSPVLIPIGIVLLLLIIFSGR